MKTDRAIELAGNAKALAEILGITPSAISQWGEDVPELRDWQLRALRPEWFENEPAPQVQGPKGKTKPGRSGDDDSDFQDSSIDNSCKG